MRILGSSKKSENLESIDFSCLSQCRFTRLGWLNRVQLCSDGPEMLLGLGGVWLMVLKFKSTTFLFCLVISVQLWTN